ncbi:MAG: hypothetical protein ACTHK7_19985 [Aureliella sp.]
MDQIEASTPDERELIRRIVSSMNTLVCAGCFSAEIMSHPELGMFPTSRGKKKNDWALAMADFAIASGWTALAVKGSFGNITPLCPACKLQRQA